MVRLLHYSDVEHVYDEPARAARLAGTLRARAGEDTLVVGTGDNTAPGVLALVERGEQALALFEAAGTDLETFGNHDFDFGPRRTLELVAASDVSWVSANVHAGDDTFGAGEGVRPWRLRDVDGATVGVFGVTDPATDSINPHAVEVSFSDPVAAAREAVAALRESGADHVVALSHLGAGDDALVDLDVDVVLGGHVHDERRERVNGTLLVRPGVGGHVVHEVDLETVTVTRHETAGGPVHEGLRDRLGGRIEAAGLQEPVATAADPVYRDGETVRAGECCVGNLVADAYRAATDADVGLQNTGGIREGPPLEGTVTRADLVSVLPFEEPVVLAEVSGVELRAVFEACSGATVDFGHPDWWQGHVSGARLRYVDDRLVEASVGGEPLDDDATYTLATAAYLLQSDHEFTTLGPRHRVGEFGIEHEVLADHVAANGLETDLGRIRRE
jgi:2',3'-cyclic-nucleotide 2'-phosphodiesterase (5'-nucleotidase family)